MKKENKILTYLFIILGNLLVAASVSFFVLPNQILTGGVAGLAVALLPVFHINEVIFINVLTYLLFIVGYLFLGKEFALRTLLSTFVYPIGVSIMTYITSYFPADTFIVEPYLASLYSGILSGIGLGLCFRVNASTGGMDIPSLILHKYTSLSSGDSVAIVDVLTILLGLAIHGLEPALIGILSIFTCTVAINKTVLLGMQSAINVMVISENWMEIQNYIVNDLGKGVTILEGIGGYSNERKPVLMCVINQKLFPRLERMIKGMDPLAFIIVNNVNEVHGEGFTYGEL